MTRQLIAIEDTNLSFYTTEDDNGWGYVITPVPISTTNSENGLISKTDAEKAAIKKGKEIYVTSLQ